MTHSILRISKRSVGEFDAKKWINEGDGLMASSRKIREIWGDHRQVFSTTEQKTNDDWNLLTGLPRASMLLLGYSVEMFLKCGLAKAYYGCSEQMFYRDVRKFSHKFLSLADEIAFPLENKDKNNLQQLQNMVLFDARYPVFVPKGQKYSDKVNQQTGEIWSQSNFNSLAEMTNRIRAYSTSIDSNTKNQASFISLNIDKDGYVAFRVGGNLPPRITYRLSSEQKQNGQTSKDDIKALIKGDSSSSCKIIMHCWGDAWIYEDGESETLCHARPKS